MKISQILLSGLSAALLLLAQPAQSTEVRQVEGIQEYRLSNGLQVLLVPDASKPTTTVNLTVRVGSKHESYGETGMAHLLEHLLFKASDKYPDALAEFSRRGFRANGTTWLDRTNYFASFAENETNLNWYLGWLADAMVSAKVARKDLDTEMTVVRNEMEMGENSPFGVLFERTVATMYQWHNYGNSTIGARSDVEGVSIERLRAFYKRYYQPDNATLVISGKFQPERVLATLKKTFGVIPKPKRVLPPLYTRDPVQDGPREVTIRRVGGVPLLLAGYHIPEGAHPDTAAIELLNRMLSEAPAGRLHKALVEQKLAAEVFGFNANLADPGFLLFGAQLAPDQDPAAARKMLIDTVEGLSSAALTESELARAKANWLRDWDQQFTDPEKVGVALSESIAQGDWRLFFLLRDRVKAVDLATVQRVASEWLLPDNRTLAQYQPTPKPIRAPALQPLDLQAQLAQFKPVKSVSQSEAFDVSPANIAKRTALVKVSPGLTVSMLSKSVRGQAVKANLTLHLGSLASLQDQDIAGTVLAMMLDKGTNTLSRQALQDRLTSLQSTVQFGGNAERISASIVSTRERLPEVITLVGQMLRDTRIDPAVFEEVRAQALSMIAAQKDEPDARADNALDRWNNPYAKGDPRYAMDFAESESALKSLTREAVVAFHQRMLGLSHAQLSVVGDFDAKAAETAIRQALENWAPQTAFQRLPRPHVAPKATRIQIHTPDKQNAALALRLPIAIQEFSPDHAALLVANFAFGGSTSARLWVRVREKEGLSYDVRSRLVMNPFEPASRLEGWAIFAPQNRAKVENAFAEEFARAQRDGFSRDEIEAAKRGLLNFRQLARAQDDRLASDLSRHADMGRAYALESEFDRQIASVTPQQASAAWNRYIKPEGLAYAVAGDFK
jgi:zinc protease